MKKNVKDNNQYRALNSDLHEKINTIDALKLVARTALPLGISRALMASNNISTAAVLANIGSEEASASPLILTMMFVSMGMVRGVLSALGIVLGNANGAADIGKITHAEIGKIMRQSWILSTILSIIPFAILLNSKNILNAFNVNDNVSDEVQKYFYGYAFGIPTTLYFICDEILAPATKSGLIPMVGGILYSLFSIALGVPMALGYMGENLKGPFGLGFGVALSSYITLIGVRLIYFFGEKYKKYDLFSMDFSDSKKYLSMILKLGLRMGFQVFTEWGNLAALSFITGSLGPTKSEELSVSLQCLTTFNLVILGYSHAIGSLSSNSIGALLKTYNNDMENSIRHKENYIKIANAGLYLGLFIVVVYAAILCLFRDNLSSYFLSDESKNNTAVFNDTKNLLMINAVGAITDTARNLCTGQMQGLKEIMLPAMIGFILMSVMGVPIGATVTNEPEVNIMFATRAVAACLAALIVYAIWRGKISKEPNIMAEEIIQSGNDKHRSWCFWKKSDRGGMNPLLNDDRQKMLDFT